MMKEAVRALDSGILPEIGLIAFFVAFVLIVIRVMLMKKSERDDAKQIPLDDATEIIPKPDTDHEGYA
ncbi:MAG TPA: cbb3-type cytochrome c oxidase subunit 3 [Rhodothermales bacterium]|nr:cbb3-type cytochrome c oxidase subunit 3 [Rhodothermales bacterium]